MSIKRYEIGPILSGASEWGGVVYLSGLSADDISQDVSEQTRQTLANIDRVLTQAGTNKSKLLRVEVWLPNMDNYEAINEVYQSWLNPENVPARACVESHLWDDAAQVEIMVTAAI